MHRTLSHEHLYRRRIIQRYLTFFVIPIYPLKQKKLFFIFPITFPFRIQTIRFKLQQH